MRVINPNGAQQLSDIGYGNIIDYAIEKLMDIQDRKKYVSNIRDILKVESNYDRLLEKMAYLELIVNRHCTPPKITEPIGQSSIRQVKKRSI